MIESLINWKSSGRVEQNKNIKIKITIKDSQNYQMREIDRAKDFASRDAIPEELKADFEYLESHMMFKARICSMGSVKNFRK